MSRARQASIGAAFALRNSETLDALRNRRPQERIFDIPQEVLDFQPQCPLQLDPKLFAKCLREAPSGSSPGPGGCTNEMLRLCLEDNDLFQLLHSASEDSASGVVPPTVDRALMSATMTALRKDDGGVRGIATGLAFRRLVAKCLARQFGKEVEAARSPFQFALSTRAGTDCVGHVIRALTDANPSLTVTSIDWRGSV